VSCSVQGSRWAGVVTAAFLIALAPAADAARFRFYAESPYWVAQGSVIAFTGSYGRYFDDARLWMINADGSGRRAVRGGWDVVSPSGSRLATSFASGTKGFLAVGWLNGELIKGFEIRVRSGEGYGPVAWGPRERAIAIEVTTTARSLIFVADLRTGRLHSISGLGPRDDESVDWSPDGSRIAFLTCPPPSDPWRCDLALGARNGRYRRIIVPKIDAIGYNVQPSWAPNGRAIAFALRFGDTRPSRTDPAPQRYGIYVVRPDGSGFRRIAATPYIRSLGIWLAWSPDSQQIAFSDTRGITLVRVSDGAQQRLTSLGANRTVSWSPSTRVLFSNNGSLYTAAPGERPLRVLP
jgi:Tol biopolymer transport system component